MNEPVRVLPAPTVLHQAVWAELFGHLYSRFPAQEFHVFSRPVAVQLGQQVAHPDLVVVRRPRILTPSYVGEAPELVVEFQPHQPDLDFYARAGVREHWLVTIYPFLIQVHALREGALRPTGAFSQVHRLESPGFPQLTTELGALQLPFSASESPAGSSSLSS